MSLFRFTEETHLAAAGKLPGTALSASGKEVRRTSIQVFANDFLEKWIGTAHPMLPGIWLLVAAFGIYQGATSSLGAAGTGALVAIGILIVTLIEYALHRVVFHMVPTTPKARLRLFILHGYHHDFPNDKRRLVLPLAFIVPIASIVALACWLALPQHWLPLFAGVCIGYVAYDWVHYYTHHFKPKTALGKWLVRYHLLHHYDSPNHRYGISSPLWDLVFGTYKSNDVRVRGMHKDRARPEHAQ